MINSFPKTNPVMYKFFFMALCVIALSGYMQPAVNVHLSLFDMTYDSGFSLATVFTGAENPLDSSESGKSELSELLGDIHVIDIMDDAVRAVILSAALYFVTLMLLLAVLILAFWGKFKLVKAVILVMAFAMYVTAGLVILTVPETAIDILAGILEDMLGPLAAFVDVSEMLQIEHGIGYWITVFALAGMLTAETAMNVKNRFSAQKAD